jgi:hypothetical protein
MRIAELAPLAKSVSPKLYCGTDRVVAWLVNELASSVTTSRCSQAATRAASRTEGRRSECRLCRAAGGDRQARERNDLFGDHTFFLDASGLNVLEPAETSEIEVRAGEIVNLASWSDEKLTSLRPHAHAPTGVVVVLESRQ